MKKTPIFILIITLVFSFCQLMSSAETIEALQPHQGSCNASITPHEVYVEGVGKTDIYDFANSGVSLFSYTSYPETFDATAKNLVTPIKNQGQYGTCWAFSTVSAIETNMIKKGYETTDYVNYSELHLAYFAHTKNTLFGDGLTTYNNDNGYYGGHNTYIVSQYLAGWQGVAKESDFPYPPASKDYTLSENHRYVSEAHLQDYYVIPNNVSAIKKAIMEYGSVTAAYYDNANDYSLNNAFYQTKHNTVNHSITIVGWDDNYALSNFEGLASIPSSPGAWKVKNSWGKYWGDEGYFWISYEEPSLKDILAYNIEPADNYHIIHQHDGADNTAYFIGESAANIFKADKNETLKAVGFYTLNPDVDYTVKIYKLSSTTSPTNGTLVSSVSGSEEHQGYHTIELNKTIDLKKDDYFSVVITLSDKYHAFEGNNGSSTSGQSYLYSNNIWKSNIYTYSYGQKLVANNACIKAYALEENFTVTFNSNGGTSVSSVKVPNTFKVPIPESPIKNNAYFAGWYKDSALTQEWDFDSDTVTKNMTLYAKWSDTPVMIESITLSSLKTGILTGDTLKINAEIKPYYASDKGIIWTASDNSITISDGVLSGTKKGTYTITASADDGSNISAGYTIDIFEPLGKVGVGMNKFVFKTTDKISYSISEPNAVNYVLCLITPDKKLIRTSPFTYTTVLLTNYNYVEGNYIFYIIAIDPLGNIRRSTNYNFYVDNDITLAAKKISSGYMVNGYNAGTNDIATGKVIAAYYKDGHLIKTISTNNSINLSTSPSFPDNTDADSIKFMWWDSYSGISPVTETIHITSDTELPIGEMLITH